MELKDSDIKKVLFVDGDDDFAEAITDVIIYQSKVPVQTTIYNTLSGAIKCFKEKSEYFHVIIVDIGMENENDGYKFIKEIRDINKIIPIFILTSDFPQKKKLEQFQPYRLFDKVYESEEMIQAICEYQQ